MLGQFHWTHEEITAFSPEQIKVCEMKRQGLKQATIEKALGLTAQAISSAICATLAGNRWLPHSETGGSISYIGDVDTKLLKQKIDDFGLNLDCLKTIEAYEIAYELRYERFSRANYIPKLVTQKSTMPPRYKRTLFQLESYVPSQSWLNNFSKANGITIKRPESLEEARRSFCTSRIIRSFFTQHSALLQSVHGENIWNADESSSTSSTKYKVLLNAKDSFAVTSISKHEQHITGMYLSSCHLWKTYQIN